MGQSAAKALDIVEILHDVLTYVNEPKTLAACARVNTLWHEESISFLWRGAYDLTSPKWTTPDLRVLLRLAENPGRFRHYVSRIHYLHLSHAKYFPYADEYEPDDIPCDVSGDGAGEPARLGDDESVTLGHGEYSNSRDDDTQTPHNGHFEKYRSEDYVPLFAPSLWKGSCFRFLSVNRARGFIAEDHIAALLHTGLRALELYGYFDCEKILDAVTEKNLHLQWFSLEKSWEPSFRLPFPSPSTLVHFLENTPQLRGLELAKMGIFEISDVLFRRIIYMPNLYILRLGRVESRALTALTPKYSYQKMRHICSLDLSCPDINGLRACLPALDNLRSFSLFVEDTIDLTRDVLIPISGCSCLEAITLTLWSNEVYDVDDAFATVNWRCTSLRQLELVSKRLMIDPLIFGSALFNISRAMPRLESLVLHLTTSITVAELALLATSCPLLRKLLIAAPFYLPDLIDMTENAVFRNLEEWTMLPFKLPSKTERMSGPQDQPRRDTWAALRRHMPRLATLGTSVHTKPLHWGVAAMNRGLWGQRSAPRLTLRDEILREVTSIKGLSVT